MAKKLREDKLNFIRHPQKVKSISQKEIWRPKEKGGIKLVNIQIKSEISKAKWLVELVSNNELSSHLHLFQLLMGVQKVNITGRDLLFLEQSYIQRHLQTSNAFYKEGLLALSSLDINKGISNVHQWDDEHIFYNKFFLQKDKDKTFYLTTHFDELKLYRFGQFLDEKVNESRNRPFDRKAVS